MQSKKSRNTKKKRKAASILKYIVLILFAIVDFYPFFWVLMSSFKDNNAIIVKPLSLPDSISVYSYVRAWTDVMIGRNFKNSVIYSVCGVFLIVLLSAMVAFVETRVIPSKLLYGYFTLGIMIPMHAVLIPTFIIMKHLHIYNTRPGFIVLITASNLSLAIFILTSFMKSIPKELDEAAYIDGCSYFKMFYKIALPMAKPGLATIGTLTFLNCWNEYLFAYIMLSNEKIKTITQGIFALKGMYYTDYSTLCAGLMIAIIPMILFFIIFQEQVIGGMTAGAVKG